MKLRRPSLPRLGDGLVQADPRGGPRANDDRPYARRTRLAVPGRWWPISSARKALSDAPAVMTVVCQLVTERGGTTGEASTRNRRSGRLPGARPHPVQLPITIALSLRCAPAPVGVSGCGALPGAARTWPPAGRSSDAGHRGRRRWIGAPSRPCRRQGCAPSCARPHPGVWGYCPQDALTADGDVQSGAGRCGAELAALAGGGYAR